ncbi:MAG TPA: ATP-binding cassette domain-containing protein, partial [Rhodospirillales bacterium]|nr:ATP-binding cassette domain-containing protein [Rhodospirillales bacterium]
MSGLHLNNVSHAFNSGNPVLNGVSVFVAPGELVCLLGPSGCGKTTLLRVAAGLEHLQVGQVTIGERVVAEGRHGKHIPTEERGIGLMFQDYALFPHL